MEKEMQKKVAVKEKNLEALIGEHNDTFIQTEKRNWPRGLESSNFNDDDVSNKAQNR